MQVYHRASGNYCYALDKDTLCISIQTDESVNSVTLVWGDPYTAGIAGAGGGGQWKGEALPLKDRRILRDGAAWWTVSVKPLFKRCRYYFRIKGTDNTERLFLEDGFHPASDEGTLDCILNAFVFPWMNEADIAVVPAWAGETVWYQIFPARFCKGKNEKNGNGTNGARDGANLLPWAGPEHPVTNGERYGGNIAGITEKLDYLADLGITGVYLTPVNVSPSQHKYDTTDYLDIDGDFGTKEDMRRFVKEAHSRGIKVMLDGVFNHVGRSFFAWQDVMKKRGASEYKDWFIINDMSFDEHDWHNPMTGKYYTFGFHDEMPKLNTNNPQVRDYICKAVEKWVSDYDIDALRLDVANEISHALCRELRTRLKGIKADFYIVGEIWHNALPWLEGDQFDAVMNYPLSNALLHFAGDKELNALRLEEDVNRCLTNYSAQVTGVLLNQLDSHDTIRAVTRLGNRDAVLQCLALLFCLPGAACIYYGTEVLLEGSFDPDCRRCMPWRGIDCGEYKDTIDFVSTLIHLRRKIPAMRASNPLFVHEDNARVVHIAKTAVAADGREGAQTIDAIFNFGESSFAVQRAKDDKNITALESGRDVLLSRGFADGILHSGGLILRKSE